MAKRKVKKKRTAKVWKFYEQGKLKVKNCPKCGKGVYLANHKDRLYCGRCHYMEKTAVKAPEQKESKPKKK
jgi:small subunit ribosomal protein S27Ae